MAEGIRALHDVVQSGLVEAVNRSTCCENLNGSPRFDIYRAPETSPQQWIELLGVDVDNKQHLFYTAVIAACIAELDGSPYQDARLATETGLVHDTPEAVTKDVNHNFKTLKLDYREADILVTQAMSGQLDIPVSLARDASLVMKEKAKGESNDETVVLFDSAERAGYMLTAQRSWNASWDSELAVSEDQRERMRWLGANVLSNTYTSMLHQAEVVGRNSATFFLSQLHDTFGTMLDYTSSDQIMATHREYYREKNFTEEMIEKLEVKLADAVVAWKRYDTKLAEARLVAS